MKFKLWDGFTDPIAILAALTFMFSAAMVVDAANAAPNTLTIPTTPVSSQSAMMAPNPAYTDAIILVANVSQTQAVPAGSRFVIFSGNCDFYAKVGASASVPGATTTDGTAAQLNPAAWWLYTGPTQITVISASACTLTLSFYN